MQLGKLGRAGENPSFSLLGTDSCCYFSLQARSCGSVQRWHYGTGLHRTYRFSTSASQHTSVPDVQINQNHHLSQHQGNNGCGHVLVSSTQAVGLSWPTAVDLVSHQGLTSKASEVAWRNENTELVLTIPKALKYLKALGRVSRRQYSHDKVTKLLVNASVLPALVLAVQPLMAASGSPAVTASIAAASVWQGPLRDMFSFTVLLSVFITCEPGAAAAAAVSAAGAALTLLLGPSSPAVQTIASFLAACAAVITCCAACTSDTSRSRSSLVTALRSHCQAAWVQMCPTLPPAGVLRGVQQVLGLLGGGLLLQFLCSCWPINPVPASVDTWLQLVAAGAAGILLVAAVVAPHCRRSSWLQQLCDEWPAWSATLLLILQPLQSLVLMTARTPVSISGQLLLVLSSGLMVPRALMRGELMWFTGTASGALLAAGQLLVYAAAQLQGCQAAAIKGTVVSAVLMTVLLLGCGWRRILSAADSKSGSEPEQSMQFD